MREDQSTTEDDMEERMRKNKNVFPNKKITR
jgi:hypothetical protein